MLRSTVHCIIRQDPLLCEKKKQFFFWFGVTNTKQVKIFIDGDLRDASVTEEKRFFNILDRDIIITFVEHISKRVVRQDRTLTGRQCSPQCTGFR